MRVKGTLPRSCIVCRQHVTFTLDCLIQETKIRDTVQGNSLFDRSLRRKAVWANRCHAWNQRDQTFSFGRGWHKNRHWLLQITHARDSRCVASECPRSKRKTTWAISTKAGTRYRRILYGRPSACQYPGVTRSMSRSLSYQMRCRRGYARRQDCWGL